jgi:hypothetical protein
MILPSKHLTQDRALLTVGATILRELSQPRTVSGVWERLLQPSEKGGLRRSLRYDSFVLALDLLFLIGAVELRGGLLSRGKS